MQVREIQSAALAEFNALAAEKGSLFSSANWASLYDPEKFKRFGLFADNNELCGGFVAYRGGTAWLPTLITPPFAQHIGLFFVERSEAVFKRNSFRKQCATAISEFLAESNYAMYKLDFPYWFNDMQPFVWNEQEVNVRYTYRFSLKPEPEHWPDAMDGKLRNMLRKAEKTGIRSDFLHRKDMAGFALSEHVFNEYPNADVDITTRLMQLLDESPQALINVTYAEGDWYSVVGAMCDHDTAYLLLNTVNREVNDNAANSFGIFEAMVEAKQRGLHTFDFEGSMIPQVEAFFRRFGGELTPMFTVRGGKFLLPALYKKWKG